jgi:hypothetical protein
VIGAWRTTWTPGLCTRLTHVQPPMASHQPDKAPSVLDMLSLANPGGCPIR